MAPKCLFCGTERHGISLVVHNQDSNLVEIIENNKLIEKKEKLLTLNKIFVDIPYYKT